MVLGPVSDPMEGIIVLEEGTLVGVSDQIHVPPRHSSYTHSLQEKRSGNSLQSRKRNARGKLIDLDSTRSDHTAFPYFPPSVRELIGSPGPSGPTGPEADAIPFPLSPSPLDIGDSLYPDQSPPSQKRRHLSAGNPYLTPPSSPDRYVPARRSDGSWSKSFRLSKSPQHLSATERLLRNNTESADPFTSRRVSHLFTPATTPPSLNAPTNAVDSAGPRPASIGQQHRVVSAGSVWNVGGPVRVGSGPLPGIANGRGGIIASGTNAPMYSSDFFEIETPSQSHERFEGRLAAALNIDQTILDAPHLRDDFYCSVLAYCHTARTLAVGLRNRVYLWSEETGVKDFHREGDDRQSVYVTSLAFSSISGAHNILAIGRSNGSLHIRGLADASETFSVQLSNLVACLAFKPVTTRRRSGRSGRMVPHEELLVGDEVGNIWYYCIEWDEDPDPRTGSMNLLAKIDVHNQQICGIAWSLDGEYFATGGNDNVCCLFEVRAILAKPIVPIIHGPLPAPMTGLVPDFVPNAPLHHTLGSMLAPNASEAHATPGHPNIVPAHADLVPGIDFLLIKEGRQRHRWIHSAAVKAIAFCPWQRGLLATGGGSNDRAIHFYHAWSGACLATINVHAQVTSLIWSTTRREIAATFGYAQPDHPYRIAVFSWPECKQVVSIPWQGDIRALYAIPYPGGPNDRCRKGEGEGGRWWSRTAEEGCIIVASSDESVKFHEVWSEARRGTGETVGTAGLLGGSDILEGLEGIDRDGGEVIR